MGRILSIFIQPRQLHNGIDYGEEVVSHSEVNKEGVISRGLSRMSADLKQKAKTETHMSQGD
jgi:hypothetical protein